MSLSDVENRDVIFISPLLVQLSSVFENIQLEYKYNVKFSLHDKCFFVLDFVCPNQVKHAFYDTRGLLPTD
jgi:hypothetical protein